MSKSRKNVRKWDEAPDRLPYNPMDDLRKMQQIGWLRYSIIMFSPEPERIIALEAEIKSIEGEMSLKPNQMIEFMKILLPKFDFDSQSSTDAWNKYASIFIRSKEEPNKISEDRWFYQGEVYVTEGDFNDDQFKLLIMEEADKERSYWESLKRRHTKNDGDETTKSRHRIKEAVRIEVWRRDGGKCVRCGSRENLEYDHIIPVSKGGSNTTRNIELLCEKCNRQKGANIE